MANDKWSTPLEIFNALDQEFGFGFDVCAEHSTAKCPEYWTIEDNALSKDWSKDAAPVFGKWLWCNPPYSKIGPWIDKAIQAQSNGVGVVMLVMCDPSVGWFGNALDYASEVRLITKGRLAFLNNGVPKKGNNKGSCIFVFDPHKIGCCHTTYISRKALLDKGKALK